MKMRKKVLCIWKKKNENEGENERGNAPFKTSENKKRRWKRRSYVMYEETDIFLFSVYLV